MFRYASDVYGQTVLVGASWDLIWWFVGAGAAFIVAARPDLGHCAPARTNPECQDVSGDARSPASSG